MNTMVTTFSRLQLFIADILALQARDLILLVFAIAGACGMLWTAAICGIFSGGLYILHQQPWLNYSGSLLFATATFGMLGIILAIYVRNAWRHLSSASAKSLNDLCSPSESEESEQTQLIGAELRPEAKQESAEDLLQGVGHIWDYVAKPYLQFVESIEKNPVKTVVVSVAAGFLVYRWFGPTTIQKIEQAPGGQRESPRPKSPESALSPLGNLAKDFAWALLLRIAKQALNEPTNSPPRGGNIYQFRSPEFSNRVPFRKNTNGSASSR